jgi:hypothetical protein
VVSREVRANHTGQSLYSVAQVLGVHLLQLKRNRNVEQPVFSFLLCLVREQTTPEHPIQAYERSAFAHGALVTSAAADNLAIQAEHCTQEWESSSVRKVPCYGKHKHQPL